MGWRLLAPKKTQKLTRQLAETYMNMLACPNDRPLSDTRLEIYERIKNAGEFRSLDWADAICLETDLLYRVNGKHTSTLFALSEDIPDLYVSLEHFQCDTLQDLARLYSTFDSRTQSRTVRDVNASFAGAIPELAGIPIRVVDTCVSAIDVFRNDGVRSSDRTAKERAEELVKYPEFVKWVYDLLGGAQDSTKHYEDGTSSYKPSINRHLRLSTVVAVMFATWCKDIHAATRFWTEVRDESGPTPDLPTRKLSKYLLIHFGTAKSEKEKHRVPDKEVYVKCIHAWNAWRANRNTDLRYFPKSGIPEVR